MCRDQQTRVQIVGNHPSRHVRVLKTFLFPKQLASILEHALDPGIGGGPLFRRRGGDDFVVRRVGEAEQHLVKGVRQRRLPGQQAQLPLFGDLRRSDLEHSLADEDRSRDASFHRRQKVETTVAERDPRRLPLQGQGRNRAGFAAQTERPQLDVDRMRIGFGGPSLTRKGQTVQERHRQDQAAALDDSCDETFDLSIAPILQECSVRHYYFVSIERFCLPRSLLFRHPPGVKLS